MNAISRRLVLVGILTLSFSTAVLLADPVQVGDWIKVTFEEGTEGGEFAVYKPGSGELFRTFCLERTEDIHENTLYYVYNTDPSADLGGVSGGNPDPISYETAYLYLMFRAGTLNNYAYSPSDARTDSATDLQLAFWFLEDEIDAAFIAANAVSEAQVWAWINEAALATANWTDLHGVTVINIRDSSGNKRQSLLMLRVPEPATLLLLGAGLLVVAGSRRFLKHS